jgi:hypothetical protein
MFGSAMLEMAIGLVFIYVLFSTLSSAIFETIAQILSLRAKMLEQMIKKLLGDDALVKKFLEHPLIVALKKPDGALPAYIEPKTFSRAVVDILTPAGAATMASLHASSAEPTYTHMRQAVTALSAASAPATAAAAADPSQQLEKVLQNIEHWYNSAMDRASAWYKQNAHKFLFSISLIIACIFNADTLAIVEGLSRDPTLRAAVVAVAQKDSNTFEGATSQVSPITQIDKVQEELAKLRMPLGWTFDASPAAERTNWFNKVVGLLLTGVALTMGAPFWFDVLNKLVNVRSSGNRPDTAAKT